MNLLIYFYNSPKENVGKITLFFFVGTFYFWRDLSLFQSFDMNIACIVPMNLQMPF